MLCSTNQHLGILFTPTHNNFEPLMFEDEACEPEITREEENEDEDIDTLEESDFITTKWSK